MAALFDSYHKWLGIPPAHQPPHHYRLLGLEPFESDKDAIEAAAEQRVNYLRDLACGEFVKESQQLLNEVARARRCLLDAAAKADYDAQLRTRLAAPAVETSFALDPEPVRKVKFAAKAATPRAAGRNRGPVILAVAGVLVLILAGIGVALAIANRNRSQDAATAPTDQPVNPPKPPIVPNANPAPIPIPKKEVIPEPPKPQPKPEPLPTPAFHFAPKRNGRGPLVGAIAHKGEVHVFYSTASVPGITNGDPFGHAVTKDWLRWDERPVKTSIASIKLLAVALDPNNASGLGGKKGEPAFIAVFSGPGKKKATIDLHLAFSTDLGNNWTPFSGNPVLPNLKPVSADVGVRYHEPTKTWILAALDEVTTTNPKTAKYAVYTSPDLKKWTLSQPVSVANAGGPPELFGLPNSDPKGKPFDILGTSNGRFISTTFDGKKFAADGQGGTSFFRMMESPVVVPLAATPVPRTVQLFALTRSKDAPNGVNAPFSLPYEVVGRVGPKGGLNLDSSFVVEFTRRRGTAKSWKDLVVKPGENPLASLSGDLWELELDAELIDAPSFTLSVLGEAFTFGLKDKDKQMTHSEFTASYGVGRFRMQVVADRTVVEGFAGNTRFGVVASKPVKAQPFALSVPSGSVKLLSMKATELFPPAN